ncbi:hypothetical protein NDU88_007607 [Pleurodeles waltl]|uniref:Uncharacterized protein n=1 Tax=Pleurodeles waltl TaxID=8319 RepID=A0AAV7QS58_PLEWA|nr:hypothetical protein NDU88_007607 [Pleurodeles waltl]
MARALYAGPSLLAWRSCPLARRPGMTSVCTMQNAIQVHEKGNYDSYNVSRFMRKPWFIHVSKNPGASYTLCRQGSILVRFGILACPDIWGSRVLLPFNNLPFVNLGSRCDFSLCCGT